MKVYKRLIKPMMLVPMSPNDYSPKQEPIEPEEKWYPEEDRENLITKYQKKESTFTHLIFEEKYVVFDALEHQEVIKQKMWNALYAEEDELEKKFTQTDKQNEWIMEYRPWLQRGFEIAIRVIAEQEQ